MTEEAADGCKRFRQVSSLGESKYSSVVFSSSKNRKKARKWLKGVTGRREQRVGQAPSQSNMETCRNSSRYESTELNATNGDLELCSHNSFGQIYSKKTGKASVVFLLSLVLGMPIKRSTAYNTYPSRWLRTAGKMKNTTKSLELQKNIHRVAVRQPISHDKRRYEK